MLDAKTDIEKLKQTIKLLRKKVKEQKELIDDYQNSWSINMFNSLIAICEEQYKLLNPQPVFLKASYKGKPETYEIIIDNMVCAFSDGRSKSILLYEPVVGIGTNIRKTQLVTCNYAWSEIISTFNRVNINLFQANKRILVNLRHYDTDGNYIKCVKALPKTFQKFNRIKLSNEKVHHFVERKSNYDKIFTLHKKLLRYKLENGIPL